MTSTTWEPCAVGCVLFGCVHVRGMVAHVCFSHTLPVALLQFLIIHCLAGIAIFFYFSSSTELPCVLVQENGRSQSSLEKREWDGPCNERLVAQLLQELTGWGVDLESFQPKDLFDTIRGRTLWCASACHLVP